MKFLAKKLCSIVMVLCIICSAIFVLPVSAAVSDIQLGTPTLAVIPGGESYYCEMRFTPTESGTYVFRSDSDGDTYASILNSAGEEVASNDDGGLETNFMVFCEMTAGQTYTLRPKFLSDSSGSFVVTLSKFDVVSLSVDNVNIAQGLNSNIHQDWDHDLEQMVDWEYYEYSVKYFALNLSDDTTVYLEDSFSIGDQWYYPSIQDTQSYTNPWKPNNSYFVTAEVMGFTDTFTITVTENPAQSLEIEDITLTHGFDNRIEYGWDFENNCEVQYDCYDCTVNFAVTLNDGTVLNSYYESVDYNNENYYINVSPYQSFDNQWKPGNTYTLTGEVMGISDTFTVTILENPVQNISVDDITVTQGFDTRFENYWNKEENCEGKWSRYYYQPTFTVNFKDGTYVQSDEFGIVNINGTDYSLSFEDDQNLINKWVPGNTYTATGSALGFEDTFEVTVEESPVVSVDIKDVAIIKGNNIMSKMYENIYTGEFYTWDAYHYVPNFTATLKDGTVLQGSRGSVYYNGDWYYVEIMDNQSPSTVWDIGTYTATGDFLGVQDTFNVSIIDSPVKSISVEPITIQEYTNGYMDDFWNDGQDCSYYVYNWHHLMKLNVEFIDGSTKTYNYHDVIEYEGNYLDLSYSFSQNPYNKWVAGGIYTEEVYLGEEVATATITITESPYKSLEILSVDPIKETDYHWIDEYGNKQYVIPNFTYKITFTDGRSITRQYRDHWEDHSISIYCSQSPVPWTVGGENLVTVSLGNLTTTFSAIITEVPDWEYIEQNGGIFITNCSLSSEEIIVPDTIDGKAVIGVMSLGDCLKTAKTLTLPDSVTYISESAFACEYWLGLETVNIGKNISDLNPDAFAYCDNLSTINVSNDNKNYSTVDGIVYNKSGDTLVVYPLGQGYTYNVPDNVINRCII